MKCLQFALQLYKGYENQIALKIYVKYINLDTETYKDLRESRLSKVEKIDSDQKNDESIFIFMPKKLIFYTNKIINIVSRKKFITPLEDYYN